jgi:hypothetical protein
MGIKSYFSWGKATEYAPPSSAEVKWWSYASTSPHVFMAWKFTFTLFESFINLFQEWISSMF